MNSLVVLFIKYQLDDQVKDDEVSGEYSMHGKEKNYMQGLGRKT
jgi:hypothetical protein